MFIKTVSTYVFVNASACGTFLSTNDTGGSKGQPFSGEMSLTDDVILHNSCKNKHLNINQYFY